MLKPLTLIALGLTIAGSGSSRAAEAITVPPSGAVAQQTAAQPKVAEITATGGPIRLQINHAVLIRLDRPARTIFIPGAPQIADAMKLASNNDREFYLFGNSPGETVIYALDANGNILLNSRIIVDMTVIRGATVGGSIAAAQGGSGAASTVSASAPASAAPAGPPAAAPGTAPAPGAGPGLAPGASAAGAAAAGALSGAAPTAGSPTR